MAKFYKLMNRTSCMLAIIVLLIAAGCSPSATKEAGGASNNKKMPDQITKIKFGFPSQSIDYLPWYVADKKGIFKKYNLDLEIITVDGGVTGLRGLQSGDFQFLTSLPESFIQGVSEGANVKMVGAITIQSTFSVMVTPAIQKIEDLKGKTVAVQTAGNGTDVLMRWLLKQHGLEADKDVRILNAGGNPGRMEALKTGQAQATLLSTPSDILAETAGLKRLLLVRDELKNYNHDCIIVSGKILTEKPEVVRAFMTATAEAIDYTKNETNRKEVTQIGMQILGINEADFTKAFATVLPSYGDRAILKPEGIKAAIDMLKVTGNLKKDLTLNDVVDESFYAQ